MSTVSHVHQRSGAPTLSIPRRIWRRRPAPPPGFARVLGLPPFQAHLAFNRGIRGPGDLDVYLAADSRLANDPMLLPDMDLAVARLCAARDQDEVVAVFGDFDTDGLTGTALLAQGFREVGLRVVTYIPNRVDEGHGLNAGAVRDLKARDASLMVTADCGVSSGHEVGVASSMGIDTIITDHHSVPASLPAAVAVVDPGRADSRYPYDGLTGAGVAFKLVEALWRTIGRPDPHDLLALAALGTVADVGPLTGENRYIVREGLMRLNRTSHPGLKALIATSGLRPGDVDVEALSFRLIPRLNSAGRVGDPEESLRLLTASSDETAGALADELELKNVERRELSGEAEAQAFDQLDFDAERVPPVVIVQHDDWHPGVLGLIAARLSESFYRPAVAISVGPEVSRASARSIPEFDIERAIRRSRGMLLRFGGHPRAAGFTVSTADLPRLKAEILESAEGLRGAGLAPTLDIECEISPRLLRDEVMSFIRSLGPFGQGNPAPVFLTRNVRVLDARTVGKGGHHLKMRVGHSGGTWDAIAFRRGDGGVEAGDRLDLVYCAEVNRWGGRTRTQLKVLDFRSPSSS